LKNIEDNTCRLIISIESRVTNDYNFDCFIYIEELIREVTGGTPAKKERENRIPEAYLAVTYFLYGQLLQLSRITKVEGLCSPAPIAQMHLLAAVR